MDHEIQVRDIKVGDRIMWAGNRSTVKRVGRWRPYRQWRVYVTLDLDVEDRPDACGLSYEIKEWVDTWSADPEEDA